MNPEMLREIAARHFGTVLDEVEVTETAKVGSTEYALCETRSDWPTSAVCIVSRPNGDHLILETPSEDFVETLRLALLDDKDRTITLDELLRLVSMLGSDSLTRIARLPANEYAWQPPQETNQGFQLDVENYIEGKVFRLVVSRQGGVSATQIGTVPKYRLA